MKEALTITQIETRFLSEWVLLENPTANKNLEIQGGKVLHHSKDRDEVYRRAVALRPKCFAVVYTGRIPKDAAIVL